MAEEFLTEEEVLQRLGMTKEQLDALVAEGELRMYRDGDTNKFKLEDIENLQRKSETDATVVIPREAEAEAVEVEGSTDDSDQTSILPLDLPEVEVPPAKAEAGEAPTPPAGQKPAEAGEPESTEILEGLDAIDLEDIVEAPESEPSPIVGEDTDQVSEMVSEAEAEDVVKAETSGIEPSQVDAETISLEPVEEEEIGVPTIEPGTESATVELEAVEETEPTVPQAPEPAIMQETMAPGLGIEEVEPEDVLTRIGLVVSGAVMLFAAIFWYSNYIAGTNSALTSWLVNFFK